MTRWFTAIPALTSEWRTSRVALGIAAVDGAHLRIACIWPTAGESAIRYAASLTLPQTIDGDSLSAQIRDGVLEISMHKSAQARARRIEVRHG